MAKMKTEFLTIGFVLGLFVGVSVCTVIAYSNKKATHDCQEEAYRDAYIKANTKLLYLDSIFKSNLFINLSKYQPEYIDSIIKNSK
jgi:hypothetical protein